MIVTFWRYIAAAVDMDCWYEESNTTPKKSTPPLLTYVALPCFFSHSFPLSLFFSQSHHVLPPIRKHLLQCHPERQHVQWPQNPISQLQLRAAQSQHRWGQHFLLSKASETLVYGLIQRLTSHNKTHVIGVEHVHTAETWHLAPPVWTSSSNLLEL